MMIYVQQFPSSEVLVVIQEIVPSLTPFTGVNARVLAWLGRVWETDGSVEWMELFGLAVSTEEGWSGRRC